MRIGYVRVSAVDQKEQRQLEAMKEKGIEKYFIEKVSAKSTDRPKLQEMLDFVRDGDTIYIHDFSRLARSTEDLLRIVKFLKERGVKLVSIKEKLDTSTPTGKLMLTMIAAINQFERENLLERQREGIAIAKAKGVYKGGHPKKIDEELFSSLLGMYNSRKINKKQFAEKLSVSRPTLDKILKEKEIVN